MALENLENKEDKEDESIYELTDGEAQEYAYYTTYWEE